MIFKSVKSILYLALFFVSYSISAGTMTTKPAAQPAGVNVKDLFAGLDEQALVAQVKEGEALMHYMETQATPEEREAFEAEMLKMFQNFSEEDWAEINKMAAVVEPYIEQPSQPKAAEIEPAPQKQPVKKNDKVKTDDSIRSLLASINTIIDTISRKIAGDLLLSDYFGSFEIKSSIALLQRLISLLSNKQNISRLSDKKNKDAQLLIEKLKTFKINLENKNREFKIEDSFGLKGENGSLTKSSNRQSDKANIKQLEAVVEEFNRGFNDILPDMEKFTRLYEKEDQEMSKLYKDLKQAAQKHAKNAQKKRGSSPAERNTTTGSQQNSSPQRAASGFQNDAYNPTSNGNNQSQKNPKTKDDKLPKAQNDKQKRKEDLKKDQSPYDQIVIELDEYVYAYDEKDAALVELIFKEIPNSMKDYSPSTTTPADINDLSLSLENFVRNEKQRIAKQNEMFASIDLDFGNLVESMDASYKLVKSLNAEEIEKLEKHESYIEILKRANKYTEIIRPFIEKQEQFFRINQYDLLVGDLNKMDSLVKASVSTTPFDANNALLQGAEKNLTDLNGFYEKTEAACKKIYTTIETSRNLLERSVKSAKRKFERSKDAPRREIASKKTA
jgi:hypothetical protein